MLYGLDRNRQQVLDEPNFFLEKRLAIGHATKHSIEASHGIHARANLLLGGEKIFARLLITELRSVGHDGSELAFELVTDIDDKRGPDIVVKRRVDDLKRPVRRQVRDLMVACSGS